MTLSLYQLLCASLDPENPRISGWLNSKPYPKQSCYDSADPMFQRGLPEHWDAMQRGEKLHYIELPLPISKPAKRTKKRKQAGGEPSNQKQADLALEVQKVLDRAAECGPGGIM